MLRERLAENIGTAGDSEVMSLNANSRVVVSVPADTKIYVVFTKHEQTPSELHKVAPRLSRLSARRTTLFFALAQCRGVLVFGHHIQLASCLAAHRLLRRVSKKCAYNAPFPWIHFTFGSRSVRMTQYAVGQSLLPMPQSEIGQRSVPLTQSANEQTTVPLTQFAE